MAERSAEDDRDAQGRGALDEHTLAAAAHDVDRGVRVHAQRVLGERASLPPAMRDFPFKIDMAQQDPRPLNPIGMQDRQIFVYDPATRKSSPEPLKELLKYLPGKVAQCRIFAKVLALQIMARELGITA